MKTVLITGASAGIGLELAKLYAAEKSTLILVARRAEALEKLAKELSEAYGVQCHIFPADLSDPLAPPAIFEFVSEKVGALDVLINNAGFGANGRFAEIEVPTHLNMMQVNIASLVHLTRLFLPAMIARKTGGVLNVASTAAFIPGPLMAVYYASKAFVLSLSEALANEVADTGVHVSCLCPGATATEFQAVANMQKSKLFSGRSVMDAATVARMGYDGLNNNKTVVVCGLANQIAVTASRFVPRATTAKIARRVQEL